MKWLPGTVPCKRRSITSRHLFHAFFHLKNNEPMAMAFVPVTAPFSRSDIGLVDPGTSHP